MKNTSFYDSKFLVLLTNRKRFPESMVDDVTADIVNGTLTTQVRYLKCRPVCYGTSRLKINFV